MKKLLALMLTLGMLASLAACGADTPSTTGAPATVPTTEAPTNAATEAPAETTEATEAPSDVPTEPESARDPELGYLSGSTYINEFLGISCNLNEYWTVATDEELGRLSGITADAMNDEALAEQLRTSGVAYAFYATADGGLVTLNIVLEDLGLLYGTVLGEEKYVDMALGQLKDALESMGLEDVTAEAVSLDFAGENHAGISIHGTVNGVDFYELLACVKVNSHMACITAGSYYEDITEDILAMFSPLEE